MDDPVKLIYKYKNNNRRTQYHIYIFVGKIAPSLTKIIESFKEKSLYETLTTISQTDYKKMEQSYGNLWYKKFFNTYHINNTVHTIRKTADYKKELSDKYGDEWYKNHIEDFKLMDKRIFYNYEALIHQEMIRKEIKKKKREFEALELIDYTTTKKQMGEITDIKDLKRAMSLSDEAIARELVSQIGGQESVMEEMADLQLEEADENEDGVIEFDEGLDNDELLVDEEMDMDEIEKIYQESDVQEDNNVNQTSNLIQMALKDDKFIKKTKKNMIEFDSSKDNFNYDDHLKNVYVKNYVYGQYIFKDDTVKTIRNKICCSILNNKKFGDFSYLAPSRQYLWSEYYFNGNIEKIMIGQKWIRRTDLLHIDIEPNNNLRIYEELRGNLKILKDNIRRYGSKIKREDDDFNIMYDYEGYFSNNEIFMLDIYNELGLGYKPDEETLRNVTDVFIKIYFPRIRTEDIKFIVDYLNNDTKIEGTKIENIYETINNDLILENQIMYDVEDVKKDTKFRELFKENYITQSVIHVTLRKKEEAKIELFRIFNEFQVSHKYPFVQYQTLDGQIIFKYDENEIQEFGKNKENVEVLAKWYETSPYGISFKVRVVEKDTEKFMAINLTDTGRVEYKTQWKEEDMATIDDIKITYQYVKDLIEQINKDNNNIQFEIPYDEEFRYAFINSIQKFILPEKYNINHNDLSEFARYFYPYIALVIEPRKRQSKVHKEEEKSKFGTYLRYKRVSKYENQARMEQRILYFMRNYDYSDQSLANEIAKQFNIPLERAMEEIDRVRSKYPNIKKSRKILKKLENIPKYKSPGIGIDIQGKQRDRYKIRVSGARNKEQLDRILTFMNIFLYLYSETFLYKKPERQIFKETLKKLTNIARRRRIVEEVVDYDKEIKTVKQMAAVDKKRIGFKPEKGQNQWTRSCQNSGDDKKRRPQQFTTADDVIAAGFKYDEETGTYVKESFYTENGKKKKILIRAVGLGGTDDQGNDLGTVYYSCNPKDNGEHMFVGFLSRSANPFGQPMPCCFKKDPLDSKNKSKKEFFLKSIGQKPVTGKKEEIDTQRIVGDQLYILQDTNKIQEGRLGFMPKYLDYFFNTTMENTRKIKQHYLVQTKTGYYFKFGVRQDETPFMTAISTVFDLPLDSLRDNLVKVMEKDKSDMIFTAINNGDIKTRFGTRDKFMEYLKTSNQLDFELMAHFLTIPGVLSPHGLNIVVFNKLNIIIKKTLEKEKVREDFTILCTNIEETDNIIDPKRQTVFFYKDIKSFYPIVFVKKEEEDSKSVEIKKLFSYDKSKNNIVNVISDMYLENCREDDILRSREQKKGLTAKETAKILLTLSDKDFHPRQQVIDTRNRCKYLITNNSTIIPVRPSGSLYNMQIIKNFELKMLTLDETYNNLTKLAKLTNNEIEIKPSGVSYSHKTKDSFTVVSIITVSHFTIPVKEQTVTLSWITEKGLTPEFRQLYDKIDDELSKGKANVVADERIKAIKHSEYDTESYQLFRLELSEFLKQPENETRRKKLEKVLTDNKLDKKLKTIAIRKMIYRWIDKNIFQQYENFLQSGGKDKLVQIISKEPDTSKYAVDNNREICAVHKNRDDCDHDLHCRWAYDKCHFALTKDKVLIFVNRVSDELVYNELRANEILQKEGYYVSDIVDYNNFTERENQKIIKSTNTNISKVLTDMFGKESIPKIGRKKTDKQLITDVIEMNVENPLRDMGQIYLQKVIENNNSIYRAYANGYYWNKHSFYDLENRNLGYFNPIQTDLANFFRSNVIDYIADRHNYDDIVKNILPLTDIKSEKNLIDELIRKISRDSSNGEIEYYILNKIYKIPTSIENENGDKIVVFDNGVHKTNLDKYTDPNIIFIRFNLLSGSDIPTSIENVYIKN